MKKRNICYSAIAVLVLSLFFASGITLGAEFSGSFGTGGLTDPEDSSLSGSDSKTETTLPTTGLPGDCDYYLNISMPNLVVTGAVDETVNGFEITRYLLSITNWNAFPQEMFKAAPDLPPCGLNNNSSRSWVDIYADNGTRLYGFCALSAPEELNDLWFAVDRGTKPPESVYIEIVDRRCDTTYRSNLAKITSFGEEAPAEGSHLASEIYFVDVGESAGSVHRWSPEPSESTEPEVRSKMTLDIPQTYTVDLDKGLVGVADGADLFFHAVTADERYVESRNGALICKVGQTPPGLSGCVAEIQSNNTSRIDINDLSVGDYLCVLTDDGCYSEVKITKPIAPISGVLSIDYTTWEKTSPETTTGAATITGAEEIIYTRPAGKILSFAFNPESPLELYYVGDNESEICKSTEGEDGWGPEVVEYTHDTSVLDLAFGTSADGDLNLFFSDVSDDLSTGTIYEIEDGVASVYYQIGLSQFGGSWDGDFAFDDEGIIYFSTGRGIPATIYRVTGESVEMIPTGSSDSDGGLEPLYVSGGTLEPIFGDWEGPIMGMAYRDGCLYYASFGTEICALELETGLKRKVFSSPESVSISDVGFRNANVVK